MTKCFEMEGTIKEQFAKALESAFPREEDLGRMVTLCFGKKLPNLVNTKQKLPNVILELIEQAYAEGWLRELFKCAREKNPGNPELQDLEKALQKNNNLVEVSPKSYYLKGVQNDSVVRDKKNDQPSSSSSNYEQLIPPCPYKGLLAFREEDKDDFFGRNNIIEKLHKAVNGDSLTTLVGNSGSGKSSVVFAGLVPKLREQNWRITTFRPYKNPFKRLASALIDYLEPNLKRRERLKEIKNYAQDFQNNELRLTEVISDIVGEHSKPLLLIVDQLEELFTSNSNESEKIANDFLDQLVEVVQQENLGQFKLLLTIRSDFMKYALAYTELGEAMNNSTIMLTAMDREELREAIEKPAKRKGVSLAKGLTTTILDYVLPKIGPKDVAGRLPLLEFALTELWKKQTNLTLTHDAYRDIGEVEGALAQYAEDVYSEFSEKEQKVIEHIFTQLVNPGEGTEDIRQVSTKAQIGAENWDLVKRLADKRLVTTGLIGEEAGEETLEIVHEALIRSWKKLKDWVDESKEFRRWQEIHLRPRVSAWEKSGKHKDALLRGKELLLIKSKGYWKDYKNRFGDLERKFISKSIGRQNIIRRLRNSSLAFLLLIGILVGMFQWDAYLWKRKEFKIENPLLHEIIRRSLKIEESEPLTQGHLLEIKSLELHKQEEIAILQDIKELPELSSWLKHYFQIKQKINTAKSKLPDLQNLRVPYSFASQIRNTNKEISQNRVDFEENQDHSDVSGEEGEPHNSQSSFEKLPNELLSLPNLKILYLKGFEISSVNELSTLIKLKALYLDDTQVDNISNLTNLQELYITNTRVNCIKGLSKLTSLKTLHLTNTLIGDKEITKSSVNCKKEKERAENTSNSKPSNGKANLQPDSEKTCNANDLSCLRELQTLYLDLRNVQQTDLRYLNLDKLEQLQKFYLYPNYAQHKKLKLGNNLSKLDNLKELYLEGANIYKWNFLSKLERLQVLKVSKANIDFSSLNNCKLPNSLKILSLSYTSINDLTCLKKLSNLEQLFIASTKISNNQLESLGSLNNLEKLFLDNTQISDLKHLEGLGKLQELSLTNTQVTNEGLTQLTGLKNLEKLVLDNTLISDLAPLKSLSNLQELFLTNTQVANKGLTQLTGLKNLEKLVLDNTQVSDLTLLKSLNNLQELSLANTQVTDFTPLKELNLSRLYLGKNEGIVVPTKESYTKYERNYRIMYEGLNNLQELSIANTQVTDLTTIKQLNLEKLYLANNEGIVVPTKENHPKYEEIDRVSYKQIEQQIKKTQVIDDFLNKGVEVYLSGDKIQKTEELKIPIEEFSDLYRFSECKEEGDSKDSSSLQKHLTIGIVTFIFEEGEAYGSVDVNGKVEVDDNERYIGRHVVCAAHIVVDAINKGSIHVGDKEVLLGKGLLQSSQAKIKLVFKDEDEKISKEKYRNWIKSEGIDLIIGYTISSNCKDMASLAEELKILTVLFDCGTPQIFEQVVNDPKYLFRTSAHSILDSVSMARYLKKLYPQVKQVGGLNQNYSWGKDSWRAFQDSWDAIPSQDNSKTNDKIYMPIFVELNANISCDELLFFSRSYKDNVGNKKIIFSSFWGGDLVNFVNILSKCDLPKNVVLALTAGQLVYSTFNENLLRSKLKDGIEYEIFLGGRGAASELSDKKNLLNKWLIHQYREYGDIPNYHTYRITQALFGINTAYEKALGDTGKLPEIDDVIKVFEGLEYESPSGKIVMALANGHQAVQGTAVGKLKFDSKENRYTLDNIQSFGMWCVNPPPHMSSSEWINLDFEGVQCNP